MKDKLKERKGITLVALVITIILLLILAGITIGTLRELNIIGNAEKAASKYNEEAEKENQLLKEIDKLFGDDTIKKKVEEAIKDSYDDDGNIDYDKLKDNLDKIEGVENVPEKITDLPITITVDGKDVAISKDNDGKVTVTVKDDNIGDIGDNEEIKWERQDDEIIGTSASGTITLKIGDHVRYNEKSYGLKKHIAQSDRGIGQLVPSLDGTTMEFNNKTLSTEDVEWRVLGVDSNGQVELISSTPINNMIYLNGEQAYLNLVSDGNLVGVLDQLCDDLYGKGQFASSARSLNVEDIKNLLGLNPTINQSEWRYRFAKVNDDYEFQFWRYTWATSTNTDIKSLRLPGEDTRLIPGSNNVVSYKSNYFDLSFAVDSGLGSLLSFSQITGARRFYLCISF